MSKKYDLRQVTIGCLNGNVLDNYLSEAISGKHFQIQQIEVDKESLKDIVCVIDDKNGNAIDIETGEYYHILKRDKYSRIIEKPEDILANHYYALRVNEEVQITDSFLCKMFLIYSIDNIMKEYYETLKSKEVIKTIGEKK